MPDEPTTPDPNQPEGGTPPAGSTEPTYQSFEDYLKAQPEAIQTLYQSHFDQSTSGLKSALDKERDKAKTASAQLRDMAKTADEATAAKLNQLAEQKDAELKALQSQLDFTTAAVSLGCKAPDKAWAVAQATGLSAEQIKADPDFASLFTAVATPAAPKANAGSGTQTAPGGTSMDDFIRGVAHGTRI